MNVHVKLNYESPESREARRMIFDLVAAIETPAYGAELSRIIGEAQHDSVESMVGSFVTLVDNAVFVVANVLAGWRETAREHGEPVDLPELLYRLQTILDREDG